MDRSDLYEKLLRVVKAQGVLSSQDLLKELGVSRATLSRLTTRGSQALVQLGQTRATRYGVLREIPALGSELPIYRVSKSGRLEAKAKMLIMHQTHYVIEPSTRVYSGLPPEVYDMAPQGFMGRAFAQRCAADLGTPEKLDDWNNDHVLTAIARRGEDAPGDLIIGKESAERWSSSKANESIDRKKYVELAKAAMSGQPAGSSAGGEQPKFAAFVDGRHCLVKFAGGDKSPAALRWRDLLICEEVALRTLGQGGISVAEAKIHEKEEMVFLEVERFDRIGARGRRGVLTLAAVDNHLFGERGTWAAMADRLRRGKHVSERDATAMKLIDAYGSLIGDSDRHFHNLALYPRQTLGDKGTPEIFDLAPAFDKLPMMFSPVSAQVVQRSYTVPVPPANLFEVWGKATELALEFWKRVHKDNRLSREFRDIGQRAATALNDA